MNLNFLKDLLQIKSTIDNPEGIEKVHQRMIQELASKKGLVSFLYSTEASVVDSLEMAFPGKSNRWITLVTHADTVSYKKKWFDRIDFSQEFIKGQGVADIKSGTLIAIEAIKEFLKKKKRYYGIRLVSSSCEEIGSPGFHKRFKSFGDESDFVFGMEPSSPQGNIFSSRNGNKWVKFIQEGESAHSGRARKGFTNSSHELMRKILNLEEYLQSYSGLTMQTGAFRSGRYFNVVPKTATARIDFRFLNQESLKIIDNALIEFMNCKQEVFDFCPALEERKESQKYADLYQKIIRSTEDRMIKALHSGGAGDVNHFSSNERTIILDGLGAVGGNLHREDEYIEMKYLETRIKSLSNFLSEIDEISH